MDIRKMVSEIKEKMDRAGGLKHVFCGLRRVQGSYFPRPLSASE